VAFSNHRIGSSHLPRRRSFMAQPIKHPITGIYYMRRKVPDDLRAALGREFKRSLKTRDPAEAKRRHAEQWGHCETAFALARAQAKGINTLTSRDMRVLAGRWYAAELDKMEVGGDYSSWLASGPTTIEETRNTYEEHTSMVSLREALDEQTDFDLSAEVRKHVVNTLRAHNIPVPESSTAAYSELLAIFKEQWLTLGDIALQRHDGNFLAIAPIVEGALSFDAPKAEVEKAVRLLKAFDGYAQERILNVGKGREVHRTNASYRAGMLEFIELCGDLPVSRIDRAAIGHYRAKIAGLPVKGKGIRNLTAIQKIALAEAEGLPKIQAATIRNKLRAISAVLSYALRMKLIAENPVIASGIGTAAAKTATRRTAEKRRRKHYDDADLATIFASPIYSASGWTLPRTDFGRAWYWMPLLMYYTGARREELAQLSVKDVLSNDTVGTYLSILNTPDEGEDVRSVKNEGSRRFIPVHPDLLALGLLEYKDALPASGQLFPMLVCNPSGYYGANFGKHWARYLRQTVGLDSPAMPVHGFRHSFKTLARKVGISEEVSDAVTGHNGGNAVARSYGTMPLARMAEEIKRYPSVPGLSAIQELK
jgi:integrase